MCTIDNDECKYAIRKSFYHLSAAGDELTSEQVYNALAEVVCMFHMNACCASDWRKISRMVMKSARAVLLEKHPYIMVIRNAMKNGIDLLDV
ncbi:MAG: hypothetical protein PHX89_08600 [bacterium]|jgi:hypothetical protein|nr:hypothetical protein [bacterium]MDD3806116.1 hypothetical protein [bacterium]MDD4558974.1 hypothetical protein [bacterium]